MPATARSSSPFKVPKAYDELRAIEDSLNNLDVVHFFPNNQIMKAQKETENYGLC